MKVLIFNITFAFGDVRATTKFSFHEKLSNQSALAPHIFTNFVSVLPNNLKESNLRISYHLYEAIGSFL